MATSGGWRLMLMAVTELELGQPRDLIEAHHSGDPEAFAELVRMFYPGLIGYARRRLVDGAAAEDAVQETLLRAYRGLPLFGGDFQVAAWLHRILANVCADEGNRRRREATASQRWGAGIDISAPPADEACERAEAIVGVADAIASLPNSYREALVLRDLLELDYAEVAERAGITEVNARARVTRARAALRRVLAAPAGAAAFAMGGLRRLGRFGTGLVHQVAPTATTISPDTLAMPARAGMATTVAAAAVVAVASVVPQVSWTSSPSPPAPVAKQATVAPVVPLAPARATPPPAAVTQPAAAPPVTVAPAAAVPTTVTPTPRLVVAPKIKRIRPVVIPVPPTVPPVSTFPVSRPAASPAQGPSSPVPIMDSRQVQPGDLSGNVVVLRQSGETEALSGQGSFMSSSGTSDGQFTLLSSEMALQTGAVCAAPSDASLTVRMATVTGSVLYATVQITEFHTVKAGGSVADQFQGYVVGGPSGSLAFTGTLMLDQATNGGTLAFRFGDSANPAPLCSATGAPQAATKS
jgi:RNA polymerase sigma-70 factor (ECF subfamily)